MSCNLIRNAVVIGAPLNLVVLVATQLLYVAAAYLFPVVLDGRTFRNPVLAWNALSFIIFNGIQVWFWWRTCVHLRLLKRGTAHV